MKQKLIKSMTGYKATNQDLTCKTHTFELGKWYEVEGELVECKNGFHFCEQLSGVFSYYPYKDTRVFKIEAQDILDTPTQSGSDCKRVCRRIKLVEEVGVEFEDDKGNTGNYNTGSCNIGDSNTGHSNIGNRNTGDSNTGYSNTGYNNNGNGNTGNGNTGNGNTGDRNSGNKNTGDGNATNYSSGFFEIEEPNVSCFGKMTKYKHDEFKVKFPEYKELCELLHQSEPIDFEKFKNLPNITPEKLERLHEKHLESLDK